MRPKFQLQIAPTITLIKTQASIPKKYELESIKNYFQREFFSKFFKFISFLFGEGFSYVFGASIIRFTNSFFFFSFFFFQNWHTIDDRKCQNQALTSYLVRRSFLFFVFFFLFFFFFCNFAINLSIIFIQQFNLFAFQV